MIREANPALPCRRGFLVALAALAALWGCEAERGEMPEVAEIETEEDEVGVELDEEFLLGPDDVGETFLVNGWVAGRPLAGDGFFLLTEWNRRIFVAADTTPAAGAPVRAVGTLAATDDAIFQGWRQNAFEVDPDLDTTFERGYYLEATRVEPVGPEILPPTPDTGMDLGTPGDAEAPADTTGAKG